MAAERLMIMRPIIDGGCYDCGESSRKMIFGAVGADVANNVGAKLGRDRVVASGKVLKGFLGGTIMTLQILICAFSWVVFHGSVSADGNRLNQSFGRQRCFAPAVFLQKVAMIVGF